MAGMAGIYVYLKKRCIAETFDAVDALLAAKTRSLKRTRKGHHWEFVYDNAHCEAQVVKLEEIDYDQDDELLNLWMLPDDDTPVCVQITSDVDARKHPEHGDAMRILAHWLSDQLNGVTGALAW
jgi:hypothetical protein